MYGRSGVFVGEYMSENDPRQDPRLSEDARLTSLDRRLKQAQLNDAVRSGDAAPPTSRGRSRGMRILSDLIGIPFGSALIGWLFDRWFDTAPWVMLAMLFLCSALPSGTCFGFHDSPSIGLQIRVFEAGRPNPPSIRCTSSRSIHVWIAGSRAIRSFFTNSALWMMIVLGAILVFMLGGMKRSLVPGRWQSRFEGITVFITSMIDTSMGRRDANMSPGFTSSSSSSLQSDGHDAVRVIPGVHPFTVTSQFTITGLLAVISFSIVLIVGFWRHGFHFFALFIPAGTPKLLLPLIFLIELLSFLVRPFSLALRLFVAMIAGHILVKVFGSFVVAGLNADGAMGPVIAILSCLHRRRQRARTAGLRHQAYVFALLTALYINDAVNLH